MTFTPFAPLVDTNAGDIAAPGNQAAGAVGIPPDAGHVHPANWPLPADYGLLTWNYPVDNAINGQGVTAGTLYLMKVAARQAQTWSNLWFNVSAAGSGASTGSFVGLYSSAGSLLTGSSDVGGSLASTGNKQLAFTTPQAVTSGSFFWGALLVNLATTQPSFRCSVNSAGATIYNVNLAAAQFRFAINGTGLTTLPASITPGSNAQAGSLGFWMGVN